MGLEERELVQTEWNEGFKKERRVCKLINEKINLSKMLPSKRDDLINVAKGGKGLIFTKRTLHFLHATYCQKFS